jgi:hypothetical protein
MDIVRGNLAYFSRFGILHQEKSGNPNYVNKIGGHYIARRVGSFITNGNNVFR